MYFDVVSEGIGVQNYGLVIQGTKPSLTGIDLSLLFAPVWVVSLPPKFMGEAVRPDQTDLIAHCHPYFVTFSASPRDTLRRTSVYSDRWSSRNGVCWQLRPAVASIRWFLVGRLWSRTHGPHHYDLDQRDLPAASREVGVAVASALVAGLGSLGPIITTYAFYTGWPADSQPGPKQYRKSNLVMIDVLCSSILS
ncbi:hypothetical protein MMC08_005172 [Hypocenomyce scalaris]|nr:hypothetical protein [Hypocenomyce scalaris]